MSLLARTSTPRVGSLSSRTAGACSSERANKTRCWVPPDRRIGHSRPHTDLRHTVTREAAEPRRAGPAPGRATAERRDSNVPDRRAIQPESLQLAVRRHIDQSGPQGVGGVTQPHWTPAHRDRALQGRSPAEPPQQRVYAGAFEADKSDDFAGMYSQRERSQPRTAKLPRLQHRPTRRANYRCIVNRDVAYHGPRDT